MLTLRWILLIFFHTFDIYDGRMMIFLTINDIIGCVNCGAVLYLFSF